MSRTTPEESAPTVDGLTAEAGKLLPEIAAGAAARERDRVLPHKQIRALAKARLFTFRVPVEHGGPGASIRQTIRFVIDLAAADSNIAQAVRPDFTFVESLRIPGSAHDPAVWYPRVLRGDVFGNTGNEIGAPNGVVRTTITEQDDHFVVSGTKFYSTGSLYADWISSGAVDDEGNHVGFTVPRDREGLELVDDFDAVGQRLTASGTTNLRNVWVYPQEIRRVEAAERTRRSPLTPLLQLFLAAVEAGIARNALDDAVEFAQKRSRPIKHSSAARSVDDPYIRHAVGDIASRAYAAEAAVLHAAGTIDEAWDGGLTENLLTEASVAVAKAQFIAVESALRSAELVFDVGGGSAAAKEHNLDRHWRNARVVANHNPRYWKAAVVGAHHLTGEAPPTSGLF